MTVAEIAKRWPETGRVLARHRIDLCCGGKYALAFVAEKHHLDLARLITELEAAAFAKSA